MFIQLLGSMQSPWLTYEVEYVKYLNILQWGPPIILKYPDNL